VSKIVTRYDPPPIPDRRFDWSAYYDPDDSEGLHYGYGSTREEALADLDRLDQELAEANDEQLRYEHETGL